MKRSSVFAVAIVLFLAALAFAQAKPNFSGTWTLDPAKSQMGGPGGGGGGRGGGMGGGELTIAQTDSELTVTRGEQKTVYKLDGSESTNTTRMGEQKSKSRWEGNTLVTEGSSNTPRGEMKFKEVRSLSADGKEMTVESTRTTPNGEMTSKMVYKKS